MGKRNFLWLVITCFFSAAVFSQKDVKISEVKIQTSAQCDMCKEKIEKKLSKESGIQSANLDMKTKVITVKYLADKTDAARIKTTISKTGYDAGEIKADPAAYAKLPACCKKN